MAATSTSLPDASFHFPIIVPCPQRILSTLQDTKEYQVLLWLPTQDLARAYDGGAAVSDLKGRRYALIEFETPLRENTFAGEKPNISAYVQSLFLE